MNFRKVILKLFWVTVEGTKVPKKEEEYFLSPDLKVGAIHREIMHLGEMTNPEL